MAPRQVYQDKHKPSCMSNVEEKVGGVVTLRCHFVSQG